LTSLAAVAGLLVLGGGPSAAQESAPLPGDKPRAQRLVEELAGRVADGKALPAGEASDQPEEYDAYCLALTFAHATPAEAFAEAAGPNVTYAHLFEEPEKYRGEVVRFRGRLKRVRRFDAPRKVRDEIPAVYECWMFDPVLYGANPLCAIVTELPDAVPVREEQDIPATVEGYFFKKYRYRAGDGWRDAPLLIGRTLRVDPDARVAPEGLGRGSFSREVVWGGAALAGVTLGAIFGLSYWYRTGDRRVRAAVAATRRAAFSAGDSAQGLPGSGKEGYP
jgi:hypothetical protein